MTERLPSELSRFEKALLFVSDRVKNGEKITIGLIDEASRECGLTPREGEMLMECYKKKPETRLEDKTKPALIPSLFINPDKTRAPSEE